jgi:hypothetical protein
MAKKEKTEEELFPHHGFPIRLEHMDGKDKQDKKTCFFQTEGHLQKYLDKSKMKKSEYTVQYQNPTPNAPD